MLDTDERWRYVEDVPRPTLLTEADVTAATDALRAAAAVSVQLQQPSAAALAAASCAKSAGRLVVLDGAPADAKVRWPVARRHQWVGGGGVIDATGH